MFYMNNFEQISNDALKKDSPGSSYSLLEIHLFLVLKEIYKQFYNGKITKEEGAKLKSLASVQYSNHCNRDKLEKEINDKRISSIYKTEPLRQKLRHELNNKDENALNTAIELIGLYSMEFWEGAEKIE